MQGTKGEILRTALELFACRGYEAVSVREIAGALGMTQGALYRHYAGKRAIFESILEEMERRDARGARDFDLPEERPAAGETACARCTPARLEAYSRAQFRYWAKDEFAALFRRMLTLEQYGSGEMNRLYQQYLGAGPLEYTEELLRGMGAARPRQRAAELWGTLFLLLSVYDGTEKKNEVLALTEECLAAQSRTWTEEE